MTFDLNTLIRQLSNLGGTSPLILGIIAVIAYLQWRNGNLPALLAKVLPFFSKEKTVLANVSDDASDDEIDPRQTALAAIDYLTSYFAANNCDEGKAAAQAVGPFLFKIDKIDTDFPDSLT